MNSMVKAENKKYQWLDRCVFALGLVVYTVLLFTLFYRQTLGNVNYYHSDMKAYILEMQGLESGYSFPYPLFFKLGALFHLFLNNPELSIALAVTVLNSLSPLVLKYYMNKILMKECDGNESQTGKKQLWLGLLITAGVFTVFFVSMVYPPKGIYLPGIKNNYVGVFTPNPFHNATYNATRPFAIVAYFLFGKILTEYEDKMNRKDQLLFALFLFLTTITKPSFTFVLVPTAGLIMVYRIIKTKFRNFVPSVKLGLCFVPTFAALIYQFFGVFAPSADGESGIGFGIATAWKLHCDNIPLAIGLALGFPIFTLMVNYKQLKQDKWYRFSWQMLVISLAEVLFMYEKGFRLPDMNFSWGYMHGIFFVFVSSLIVLIRRTWKKEGRLWLTAAQWLAYGWHLACGIYYFMGIFAGGLYY
ncbi:MAG: hypothetical protein IJZ34_00225 [Lachnospiraceae bacterium]|nr:hypothetical protein [Lachnospiraceae bacterium]